SVGMDGQAPGDELLIRELQRLGFAEIAVSTGEGMDDVKLAAASEQRLAVGREGEAVERLVDNHTAANLVLLVGDVERDGFVRAETRVQDGQPLAAGVQRDVHRKIAKLDLLARRLQRPGIRQANAAAGLSARQHPRGSGLRLLGNKWGR